MAKTTCENKSTYSTCCISLDYNDESPKNCGEYLHFGTSIRVNPTKKIENEAAKNNITRAKHKLVSNKKEKLSQTQE